MKKIKALVFVLSILLIVGVILTTVGFYYFNWFPETEYYGHMYSGWMMPFGMIGMVLFWIFIAFVVITFFEDRENSKKDSALEHLKERLSKGEISIQEYEVIYKRLKD
ncbi:MAG: hypothetical protein NUK62_00405 [Tenericutes bacterium]|nr:hypothetical protein [Mycoplasmatota bacterium]